jgi:tetratricopeptide (TPR) repeat protein
MKRMVLATTALAALAAPAWADDIIRTDGSRIERVQVIEATFDEVKYEDVRVKREQRLAAADVEEILFEEPRDFASGLALRLQGNYADARTAFQAAARVEGPVGDAGAFMAAETDWWEYAETRAATSGEAAARSLQAYVDGAKPKKGFYVPRALYLIAKLACKLGKPDAAAGPLAELGAMTGDARKLLAELGGAEAALAKGEAQRAATQIRTVMTRSQTAKLPVLYRMAVPVRGEALIAEKRYDEAISSLEEHLSKATRGAEAVFDRSTAQASNVLGDAYVAKGGTDKEWEALYRYIWTTVLFVSWRAERAEALAKAAGLAEKLGQKNDAERLRGRLQGEFPGSAGAGTSK